MAKTQKLLKPDQLEAFYHDNFVKSQVADFIALTRSLLNPSFKVIVDIGGGWAISQKPFRMPWAYQFGYSTLIFDPSNVANKQESTL